MSQYNWKGKYFIGNIKFKHSTTFYDLSKSTNYFYLKSSRIYF